MREEEKRRTTEVGEQGASSSREGETKPEDKKGTEPPKPELPIFTWCSIELDSSDYFRRCFMSGEFCSRQGNVKRERRELHDQNRIRAFVDMSYSNISDVLYKWRIKSFIESLKNRLYFNHDKTRLYCIDRANMSHEVLKQLIQEACPRPSKSEEDKKKILETLDDPKSYSCENPPTAGDYKRFFEERLILKEETGKGANSEITRFPIFVPVRAIEVIRADSDPSTNYVICNRVCQQMQISDLIVADVSVENANVFYELGMAVAMGKMILPVCYSERYYEAGPKTEEQKKEKEKPFEHHIDCFPWRRTLFEHFGIRFRNDSYSDIIFARRVEKKEEQEKLEEKKDPYQWETHYLSFEVATQPSHGFSDVKYDQFPYLEKICVEEPEEDCFSQRQVVNKKLSEEEKKRLPTIGKYMYEKLSKSYNYASYDENTLVLYTMDSIINETQAAHCIINYYQSVVRQFRELHCFQGERVGVLLQSNEIPEDPKDGSKDRPLRYSAGEIIQIGVNQATYKSHMDLIKPEMFLDRYAIELNKIEWDPKYEENIVGETANETEEQRKEWWEASLRYVKEFVRNRAIPIYSDNPVYVKRVTDGLQEDIFADISLEDSTNFQGDKEKAKYFFSLYQVMLRTLRYTNEVVVDISTNSLQSFFWLGAAHASETSAITIRRDESDKERQMLNRSSEPRKRGIFDVAGLWTAVYATNATESFYEQLAKAQSGIEARSRLVLRERTETEAELLEDFWKPNSGQIPGIRKLRENRGIQENKALESYYRNLFWRQMLCYNRLRIYLLKTTGDVKSRNAKIKKIPRQIVPEWDVEAIGLLSDYLSKKTQIGEYRIKPLEEEQPDATEAGVVNAVFIGQRAVDEYKFSYGEELGFSNNRIKRATVKRLDPEAKADVSEAFKTWNYYNKTAHLIIQHIDIGNQGGALQKESGSKERRRDYFKVYIAGESGPATKALASNLVDDDVCDLYKDTSALILPFEKPMGYKGPEMDKIEIDDIKKRRFPLLTLQKHQCEEFLRRLSNKLKEQFEEELDSLLRDEKIIREKNRKSEGEKSSNTGKRPTLKQTEDYYQKVSNISQLFLSTVLYRLFFPLLSEKDVHRICSGMKMLICSLRAANQSPFALHYTPHAFDNYSSVMPPEIVQNAADILLKALDETLTSFNEIKVRYSVEVKEPKEEEGEIDKREILGIIQKE